jgi:outer membrane protein OmpA-like peptidoglycan-associated protein
MLRLLALRAVLWWLVGYSLALAPRVSRAQTLVGDGLRGDYYDGLEFKSPPQSRVDGIIHFNWPRQQPISGVPPEYFTVRWTGWLVPPTSGRYVLHVAADDGVRLWVGGQLLIDEWRGQSLSFFQAPVKLEAGKAYPVRLDYAQYSLLAHIELNWELPQNPEVMRSWRTLWGRTKTPLVGGDHREFSIPTQYLFSQFPGAPAKRRARAALAGARVAPPHFKPMKLALSEVVVRSAPLRRPKPRLAPARADTLAARLAKGQALTLRALYFEQGKADLPAPVQASLDTLAQALRRYPRLRLEVQGHTDNQGDPELNRQLSQRRAEAVCGYLAVHGVAAARLQPLGLGGTQPVADNSLPAERPRNRRVVLRPLP